MTFRYLLLAGLPLLVVADDKAQLVTIETGKVISVKLDRHAPMRTGAGVSGTLTQPVYFGDQVALPTGLSVIGHVAELKQGPSRKRVKAILDGDFTPPHEALVQFDYIVLGNGQWIRIQTRSATGLANATEVMYGVKEKNSLLHEPDRLQRIGYAALSKLPFHREHLSRSDGYNVQLLDSVQVPLQASSTPAPETNLLNARLVTPLNTSSVAVGSTVEAVVTAPYRGRDGKVLFPEGTRITGRVTEAESARMFQRQGHLRFFLDSAHIQDGRHVTFDGSVASIQASRADGMKLDAEGGLRTSRSRLGMIMTPISVIGPARAAKDFDLNKTAFSRAVIGLSGFGLLGSAAAQANPATATGFGAYRAAKSIYWNFLGRGKEVELLADTPIKLRLDRLPP